MNLFVCPLGTICNKFMAIKMRYKCRSIPCKLHWKRKINKRGGSTPSTHAFGAAIDHDPCNNRLRWGRLKARLANPSCEEFWRIWESEGWVSLGRTKNYDWMHIQAVKL
jgi:hypothetical protein